jgi:tetratricopeptide (TPR) repeat protein
MRRRFYFWTALLATVVGAACVFGAEAGEDFFSNGLSAYERGDYPSAIDQLTEGLVRHPRDQRAQRLLAAAGQKLLDRDEAGKIPQEDLRRIIAQAEKVMETRRREIRRALGELKVAERASRRLAPQETLRACRGVDLVLDVTLGDDPDSRRFREYLHSVCSNLETALLSGVLVNPADEQRVLGYVAFCRTDWKEAASSWEQALKLQPKDEHLRDLWREATERTRQAESLERVNAIVAEAETAIAQNRGDDGLSLLKKGLAEFPGNERMLAFYEKTQKDVARQLRDRLILFHRSEAVKHQRAGKWIDAAQSWLAVLAEDPLDLEAKSQLERIRRQLSSKTGRGEASGPPSPDALDESEKIYTVGLLHYADGDLDSAVDKFRACLKLNPGHGYARKALERVEEERKPPR